MFVEFKACLNIDITITILVNDVIPSNSEGKIALTLIIIFAMIMNIVPPFSLASTFNAGNPPKVSIANVLFMKIVQI